MLTFVKRIETAFPIQLIAVLFYGVCLVFNSGCKKENITGPDSGAKASLSGRIVAAFHSDLNIEVPLSEATLRIDSMTVTSDSLGNFSFASVSVGKLILSISAPGIFSVDTSVTVTAPTTHADLYLSFFRFGGTLSIYDPTSPWRLIPLKATMLLDGKYSLQTSDEEHNFNGGFLLQGSHTLHIDSTTYTHPMDTTFLCCDPYDYGGGNDYRFYVKATGREFKFPADVGTTWQYDYQYGYYDQPGYVSRVTHGTHMWTLASTSVIGSNIRAFLTDIRNDTTNIHYADGYRTDSSYTSADTVSFSVFTSDSSIGLSSPEWRDALPRYYSSGGDTLIISPYLGGIPEELTTTWVNGVGLISVKYSYGSHVSTSTTLILREFTKP